ncbi:uncharacterized protein LOC144098816 [Amblyomma americanum]
MLASLHRAKRSTAVEEAGHFAMAQVTNVRQEETTTPLATQQDPPPLLHRPKEGIPPRDPAQDGRATPAGGALSRRAPSGPVGSSWAAAAFVLGKAAAVGRTGATTDNAAAAPLDGCSLRSSPHPIARRRETLGRAHHTAPSTWITRTGDTG